MRKTNYVGIFTLIFVLFAVNVFGLMMAEEQKGLDEFLTYLKENKDTLKYSTYGLIEHAEDVVVKIYGPKSSKLILLENLKEFNHKEIAVEESSADQIIFTVTFYKVQPPEEEKKTEAVESAVVEEKAEEKPEVEKKEVIAESKEAPQPEAKKPEEIKKKCPRKVKVQIREMVPQNFQEYKYFEKPVSADQEVELTALLSAKVKEVLVSVGDRVTKDQVLVVFDSEALEKEVRDTQAQVEKWKKILYQRQHWKERSSRAEKQAEEKLEEAKKMLTEKETELSQAQVRAPFDGRVLFVVTPEESLEIGAVVLKMETDHIMKVEIDDIDAQFFTPDQEIKISAPEYEETLTGIVTEVDGKLKIRIKNEGFKLSTGKTVKFRVLIKTYDDALVLPESEILKDEQGSYVYIVFGKRASRRDLALGPVEKGQVLIFSGLEKGDEVIVTNVECLKEGKRIKVMVFDPESGILKPRKKVKKPIKKPVIIKKEVIPKKIVEKKYILRINAGGGHTVKTGSSFTDVYGTGAFSGLFSLAYPITKEIEIFLSIAYSSKTGRFSGADNPEAEISTTLIPVYLGGRYYLKQIKKFRPYLGAALAYFTVYEKYTADWIEDIDESGFGFSLVAGALWEISSKLNLFIDLKYDYIRITPLSGETADLSGIRPIIGLSIKF
jgi:RND family efflux transporter MFP subunit